MATSGLGLDSGYIKALGLDSGYIKTGTLQWLHQGLGT